LGSFPRTEAKIGRALSITPCHDRLGEDDAWATHVAKRTVRPGRWGSGSVPFRPPDAPAMARRRDIWAAPGPFPIPRTILGPFEKIGGPDTIRTCDLRLRRAILKIYGDLRPILESLFFNNIDRHLG